MKRVLFSASVAALMLNVTSCQNEEITEKQEGQMVTIQAAFGTGTRTTLEENGSGYATKWSAGDQIYVADEWGFVSGVLTLVEGEGKSSGTFSGVVSGNPAALSYAVFPVPADGKIGLNTVDASQTDAPMSASINGLKANFKNECGLVKLTVYNLPENADIRLSAKDIAGSLLVNAQDGTILESSATGDEIKIQNAKSGQAFFVPVLAGDTPSQAEFTLSINGAKKTFNAKIQKGKVTIDNVPELYMSGNAFVDLDEEPGTGSDIVIEEIESAGSDQDQAFEDAVTSEAKEIIVKLKSDVTYDVAAWASEAMGGAATEKITIIGNGHTITFNQTNSDWNNIVTNGAILAIYDAHITNAGYNDGPWNRHDLNFDCDVELTDVVSDKAIALKAGGLLTNVTINDKNTSDTYALWIQPKGQTVTLSGCTIDMIDCSDGRGIKIDNQYIAEADEKKVTLNVSNTTFKTEEKSAILVKTKVGAVIKLDNVDIADVAADNTNPVWVDEATASYAELVVVTGGNKIVEP